MDIKIITEKEASVEIKQFIAYAENEVLINSYISDKLLSFTNYYIKNIRS